MAIHNGCPIQDADNDLVPDEKDKCPQTPGLAANGGCPQVTSAERDILDLAINDLYFDTNKSIIKPESYRSMDKLAKLLKQRPSYRVKIEGHTDSRGDKNMNYELSKNRSLAVQEYLIQRGVSPSQLQVEYFGETKPAASNVTEKTRRFNRRVEMSFIWD